MAIPGGHLGYSWGVSQVPTGKGGMIMKMIIKLISLFLIIAIMIFFVCCNINNNKLEAEPVTATTLVIVAAVLIVAGYGFYNYDDMISSAEYFYSEFPADVKEKYDKLALIGSDTVQITNTMLDEVYSVYESKFIWNNESLKDAWNNIYGAIVYNFSYGSDIYGDISFINVVEGGGYYTSTAQFPSYDNLKHKKSGVNNLGGTSAILACAYSNIWAWSFKFNGQTYYYSDVLGGTLETEFINQTRRVINSITYSLKCGTFGNYYRWPDTAAMSVTTMAINNVVKPYIVRKSISGTTNYYELWTPVSSDTDYVIDYPTDQRIRGGATYPIDIQYGKDAGIKDREKTGADVLGGTDTRDITIPISNSATMLGTNSAGALSGEWADTTEYSATGTAVSTAAATWAGYAGELKEMDIPQVVMTRFPFCIPFDLAYAIGALAAEPVAPIFNINGLSGLFSSVDIEVDFSKFQLLATIIRWGILILFNIGLIKLTRTIIRG